MKRRGDWLAVMVGVVGYGEAYVTAVLMFQE